VLLAVRWIHYHLLNSVAFNIRRKSPTLRDGSRRSSGSAFQVVGPSTEKARRPNVLCRYSPTRLELGSTRPMNNSKRGTVYVSFIRLSTVVDTCKILANDIITRKMWDIVVSSILYLLDITDVALRCVVAGWEHDHVQPFRHETTWSWRVTPRR